MPRPKKSVVPAQVSPSINVTSDEFAQVSTLVQALMRNPDLATLFKKLDPAKTPEPVKLPEIPQGFHRAKSSGNVSLAVDYMVQVSGTNPRGTVYLGAARLERFAKTLESVGCNASALSEIRRIGAILTTLNPDNKAE